LRAQLIQQGRIRAAKYSWKRMASQTSKIYDLALGAESQESLSERYK
jgi:hypothetical protein